MKRTRRIEVIRYRRRTIVTEEREPPSVDLPLDSTGRSRGISPPELKVVNTSATQVVPVAKGSFLSSLKLRNFLRKRGWLRAAPEGEQVKTF